jgi:hypothetical protein
LMEHIHNNLMKLGGSLGNVPQKMKEMLYFGLLVHFQELKINCTLENGLRSEIYRVFITSFSLPSDPLNFIKLS